MFHVERVGAEWIAENGNAASLSAFGGSRSADLDRAQFAIVSFRNEKPTGYVTCIEMDSETVYWQVGGAFDGVKRTLDVVPSYLKMIDWALERYKRITTRIENTNIEMLHLAMKMGFRIVGTWNFKNQIYLELLNERES